MEDLVATLEDDDVVAAVVGGAVPYLDRGSLLDPLDNSIGSSSSSIITLGSVARNKDTN